MEHFKIHENANNHWTRQDVIKRNEWTQYFQGLLTEQRTNFDELEKKGAEISVEEVKQELKKGKNGIEQNGRNQKRGVVGSGLP